MKKAELIEELARSRQELSIHLAGSKKALSPTTLVQRSVKRHRIWWIAGASAAGVLLALRLLPRKTDPRNDKNGRDKPSKTGTTGSFAALLTGPLLSPLRKAAFSYLSSQLLTKIEPYLKPPTPPSAAD